MAEITVKLVRSRIGTPPAQRREQVKSFKDTPAIRGIIGKVSHLVALVD